MTTWNETTINTTSWGATLNTVQVILTIDNTYNINYPLVDINGRSQKVWNETVVNQTSWQS